jgi:hypothetical protein
LFLLTQLKLPHLTDDQKGDILAELTVAISHLHVHTENLPDLIGDEIEALPSTSKSTSSLNEYTLDELLAGEIDESEEVSWGKPEGEEVW